MSSLNINITQAKSIIDALIQENSDFPLWHSIRAQLEFIGHDFDEDGAFKNSADLEVVKK